MIARTGLLRESSSVAYRRLPHRCDSELIVNVPCQHSTWHTQNAHTNTGKPPMKKVSVPSATGDSLHQRLSQASSGYLAKSLIRDRSVASRSRVKIQPWCAHQKPDCLTEWRSP